MRRWLKWLLLWLLLIWLLNCLGVWDHVLFETAYYKFRWPPYINVASEVAQMRKNKSAQFVYYNHWFFLLRNEPEKDCEWQSPPVFRLVIKSKNDHFWAREAIRQSWARRTTIISRSLGQFAVRRTFLLGLSADEFVNRAVMKEHQRYDDILQGDFLDSYRNNSQKTMMGFDWLMRKCRDFRFVLFVDDDFLVFLPNAFNLIESLARGGVDKQSLYLGFRFDTSPFRSRWSKHYIPLAMYPFSRYPPYIAAGAYLMSAESVRDFYYASFFAKVYELDDVYLGILAKLLAVEPIHSDRFSFWVPWFYESRNFNRLIAAHGFSNPENMLQQYLILNKSGKSEPLS